MNFIKRRALALGSALVFFLTGCSYNGKTVKEEGEVFQAVIDDLLEEVKPIKGEKEYKGEEIKIFASYDPALSTYKFNVMEKVGEKSETLADSLADYVQFVIFDRSIPLETVTASGVDHTFETYKSLTEENTTGDISVYSLNGDGYNGFYEATTVIDDYDVKGDVNNLFATKSSSVIVDKDGENIKNRTDVIVMEDGRTYFGGSVFSALQNYCAPTISQGYLELTEGKTYSESQLSYLQDKLDEITLSTNHIIQNKDNLSEDKRIELK